MDQLIFYNYACKHKQQNLETSLNFNLFLHTAMELFSYLLLEKTTLKLIETGGLV